MKADKINACYIGPAISPEQFIAEHFFLYLVQGTMHGYDGHQSYTLQAGECCLVRKNHLARYNKQKENDRFEKVVVIFDETFLKKILQKHPVTVSRYESDEAFIHIDSNEQVTGFLQSLTPHYKGSGEIDPAVADSKREELLQILLQTRPELANVFFDFGIPGKTDLEAFMNRNYKFNVSMERFAYLTGRSLSSFKRDFKKIFGDTPNRWLIQKRLQEAYFQLALGGKKTSDIYIDLGFEDLSHFSYVFKKRFGIAPSKITDVI